MLAFSPSAFAATVSVDSDTGVLSYVAGLAEANDLTIARPPGGVFSRSVQLTDPAATIVTGAGCTSVSAHEALCVGAISVNVDAGDMDDSITILGVLENEGEATEKEVGALVRATISGGDGADVLAGSDAEDTLRGDAGADTLSGAGAWTWSNTQQLAVRGRNSLEGGTGNDTLNGGRQTDVLVEGAGADLMSGGHAGDWTDYSASVGPITVTLDDAPGDGEEGENDNVQSDVEGVIGTPMGDRLVAGVRGSSWFGGRGDDTLLGNVSDDGLGGGDGKDYIRGADGKDNIYGHRGNDVLKGNGGFDYIEGNNGADVIRGGGWGRPRARPRVRGRGQRHVLYARRIRGSRARWFRV